MSESSTSSRTTMSTRTTPSTRQPTSVIPQDTSRNGLPQCCMHVHQPTSQVCKPGESLALRKVKHPHNGKTSVSRFPLTKQDILSQYSGCFEGIGCFPGDPYKFHLKPDYKLARHAPRKVPVHLEAAFKEEIESLVEQGILEEVKEHTDWVNSYVIVEKDTGNHHSPNHTVKKKLRICLDPRDLNEALERELYYTHSTVEITTKFPSRDRMEHAGHFPTSMEMCMDDHLTLITEKTQRQHFQDKTSEQSCSTHSPQKSTVFSHVEFPPGMENTPNFPGKQFLQGKEKFVDTGTFTLGTTNLINFLNRYSTLSALTHQATDYKPGRVHQNFQWLKMENSNMEAFPNFNVNAETTLQMDTSKKGPRANLTQKVIPMNPEDDIQLPFPYVLSRPLKAMAQWRIQYMPKEVHILSGPSTLQPVTIALPHNDHGIITQYTPREKDQDLPQLPSISEAQDTHRESATAVSQALITSCKLRVDQHRMVTIPKVYKRTRSMLKIRCTNIWQTRHNYSQSTETEKAKFQTPFTYNDERNFVECNSVKKTSDDLVHPTKSDITSASASIFSEEREEIAEDVPVPADISAPALETVEEQPYTPGSRKSTRKNLGRPASTFSDFYM